MSIFISNFGRRVADYAYQNRARLIRLLVVVIAALIVVALIFIGVSRWQSWRYEKRVQALEGQRAEAETRAREAEVRAAALKVEIQIRQAELKDLEVRATTTDAALKVARGRTVTLKEAYETIRYVDVPVGTPVSVADACRELAAIGYRCQ